MASPIGPKGAVPMQAGDLILVGRGSTVADFEIEKVAPANAELAGALAAGLDAYFGNDAWRGGGGGGGGGGPILRSGAGAPSAGLGTNGDAYIDTTAWTLRIKAAGAWGAPVSLIGPAGSNGTAGAAGAAGATIHTGAGAPSAGLGVNGDLYFDTVGRTLHVRATGAWGGGTSLLGPAGPQGDDGAAGLDGSLVEFSAASGFLRWRYVGGVDWVNLVALSAITGPAGAAGAAGTAGAPGTAGAAGAPGSVIRSGTGAPGAGVGVTGDWYLDTTARVLYGPKGAGGWPGSGTSLAGTPGTPGTAGADGRTILSGSGAPAAGLGANGDFHLDTTLWEIRGPKAAGAWPAPQALLPQVEIVAAAPAVPDARTFYVVPSVQVFDLAFDDVAAAGMLVPFNPGGWLAPASMDLVTDGARTFLRLIGTAGGADSHWTRLRYPAGDGRFRWLCRMGGTEPATTASRGPEPLMRASVGAAAGAENAYSAGPLKMSGSARLRIRRLQAGVITDLVSPSFDAALGITHNQWYWHECQIIGSTISTRVYPEGAATPSTWQATATDGVHAAGAGSAGFSVRGSAGLVVDLARVVWTPASLL